MNTNQPKYDVLIPVAKKDTAFVKNVVTYINRNLIGCENIYIVTNQKNFQKLQALASSEKNVKILDENALVPELNFGIVAECMEKKGAGKEDRVGWYFQQLLKFAFAKSQYAKEYYLTWDADTIPLTPISFFDGETPLFTKKIEHHKPYFVTLNRILGFGKLVDFSFIAEHMIFKVPIVKEMLDAIAVYPTSEGNNWVEKIMFACHFAPGQGPYFSEFETFGNYCVKYHPSLYQVRQLNTFRSAGMIRGRHINEKLLDRLAFDLNIASFEAFDALFPYNITWTRVKNKLVKIARNLLGGGKLEAMTIEFPCAECTDYKLCA